MAITGGVDPQTKELIEELNQELKRNTKSTSHFNKIMIRLTVVLIVLTATLVWLTIELL